MAHIALVIPNLVGGGAERVVITLARGFCERGHRVDLVLFSPIVAYTGELPETARLFVLCDRSVRERQAPLDVPDSVLWRHDRASRAKAALLVARAVPACVRGAAPPLALRHTGFVLLRKRTHMHRRRRSDALRLLHYVERERPDILFANLFGTEYAAFFAGMLARKRPPVVPILHNVSLPGRRNINRRGRLLCSAARVVAVSEGVAGHAADAYGLPAGRIAAIHNPIAEPHITELAKADPDHPWFAGGGPPIILGAGRLALQKDFPTLIEAFRLVLAEQPSRLVILGEGPLRRELEQCVRALGLDDCVSLPGRVANPFSFMARARLFVLSSRHEGFGNVLAEALACGCPVVSTDCPAGPSEILGDPALLAPVGDPEALARVMLRTLDRPTEKAALRARAMRFSVERAVDAYERLITDILAQHRKANSE